MSLPKFYIYRNLHRNTFSIKYKGKILEYLDEIYCINVKFKVNEAGRQRVLESGQKNVHAYVVCDNYSRRPIWPYVELTNEITYNPYYNDNFVDAKHNFSIQHVQHVLLKNNKIYY